MAGELAQEHISAENSASIEEDNKIILKGFIALIRSIEASNQKLREYDKIPVEIEDYDWSKVYEYLGELLIDNPLELKPLVDLVYPSSRICKICASDKVGAIWIGDGEGCPLVVYPKIEVDQLIKMLYWAYFPGLEKKSESLLEITDIIFIIPAFYLEALENLIEKLGKVLRKSYIYREEELRGRIKGRPQLSLYFKQNKPRFRDQYIPCCWWDLSQDNDYNRSLKLGLEICRKLAIRFKSHFEGIGEKTNLINTEIINKAFNLDPYFSMVNLDENLKHKINRLRCVGNFAPYKEAIEYLKLLLKFTDFSLSGKELRIKGIVICMYEVFEKCVLNYLEKNLDNFTINKQTSRKYVFYPLNDPESVKRHYIQKIIPDGIIAKRKNGGKKKFIIDTKWKEAWSELEGEGIEITAMGIKKVRNSDLFQVIAYGMHEDVQADGAILVYPVADETDSQIPPWRIDGFKGEKSFPVYIVGLPVQGDLDKGLSSIKDQIKEIIEA